MFAATLESWSSSLVKWLQSDRRTISGFSIARWISWYSLVSFVISLNGFGVLLAGLRESVTLQLAKFVGLDVLDDDCAKKSVLKLSAVVAMIPVCSVRGRFPLVNECGSRLYALLR